MINKGFGEAGLYSWCFFTLAVRFGMMLMLEQSSPTKSVTSLVHL